MIYKPAEDSFLLSSAVEKYLKNKIKKTNLKFLDLGTGSGIITETLIKNKIPKQNITASDIDIEAVNYVKNSLKIRAVKSNLFNDLHGKKFDIIIFNPPYLPENKHDKEKDTTGGKSGDETILKFLKQAQKHMNKNAKIFLLISSLTPRKGINKEIKKQNFKIKKLAEKNLFFEKLEILLIQN